MDVAQLWRYPVKSLAGEPLAEAHIDGGGIAFDRRYAIMDSDPARAGKPLTAVRQPRLLAYRSEVRDGAVCVETATGKEYAVGDGDWLAELERDIGKQVSLRGPGDPIHDDSDLLIVNSASLRVLSEEYGAAVNPLRFRPNVIVDGKEAAPFAEEAWPGRTFALGDAVIHAVHPCERCVVTTIDPQTLASDPSFLRLLVEKHQARFGVYCKVVRPGIAKVGDPWRLIEA